MKQSTTMRTMCLILGLTVCFAGCDETLTETNINPNGVSPETANPNLLLPNVLRGFARDYTNLGEGNAAGVVQHMQEDGWYTNYNEHRWGATDWTNYYQQLNNMQFVYERAVEGDQGFHQGIALTMRGLIFGHVADLWGDAPYSQALRIRDEESIMLPAYDSQQDIYLGVLEELKQAVTTLASANPSVANPGQSDLYYNGDIEAWQRFANSLILRFAMRLSEKLPDVAESHISDVYASGLYIESVGDEAALAYNNADPWPTAAVGTDATDFRRRKPANTLLDKLIEYDDPRLEVWFAPVHVRWVEDTTLETAVEPTIRRNGELTDIISLPDEQFVSEIAAGNTFTRHFNPDLIERDSREYVGLPPAMLGPDTHNGNPTPGQQVQNQHVSQLSQIFRETAHELVRSRIISASEVHFILAEAALRGWIPGSGEEHYNNGVRQALEAWGVGDRYEEYIATEGVAWEGTIEQIMEQKWIGSFLMASESWFDYRRTGYPEFEAGPGAAQSVLPLRYMYGENELNANGSNVREALQRLEETSYSTIGPNSPWSRPWLLQGTGKPWE